MNSPANSKIQPHIETMSQAYLTKGAFGDLEDEQNKRFILYSYGLQIGSVILLVYNTATIFPLSILLFQSFLDLPSPSNYDNWPGFRSSQGGWSRTRVFFTDNK